MSVHTPGPWTWRHSGAIRSVLTVLASGVPLLRMYTGRNEHANACLIAMAPEMLAALEMISVDDDGEGYVSAEGMAEIRRVITKAKGE